MKTAICVALVACVATYAYLAGAVTTPASDLRQNLYASCFINESEGWTVGDLGRIFHTTDAGRTWERTDAGTKRPFVAVACPQKTALWVAGQSGQIAHSSDGGKTWKPQVSGTERNLLDVAFATPQRGIAVGDFGTMLRTDDGGATWTKIPLPHDTKLPPDVAEVVDPGDVVLYGVSFPTPERAWVVGEFGVILESTDGGQTWHGQDSPVEKSLFGVSFADEQKGWAVGLEATLLRTTDGGISWEKQAVTTPKGFQLALYDVEVHGNYAWAVGENGFLLNSKDAGATWQLAKIPVQMGGTWFRGISLLPDGRGFIVGARGVVLAADRDSFTPLRQGF